MQKQNGKRKREVTMPTKDEWITIIEGRGGKIDRPTSHGMQIYGGNKTHVDASWFYSSRNTHKENMDKKPVRDLTAREMRKDGWIVKTTTNSLGWFLYGSK
jgi:hypothetical protein